MDQIVIGKQVLESLTAGMYTDPCVIYREFIQNSVDSIDNAYKEKFFSPGEESVVITIDNIEHYISVKDNGLGVKSDEIYSSLISIGNSQKDISEARGFRGIGRLAALSYCQKLVFSTTAPGEKVQTKVTFDANRLSIFLSSLNKRTQTVEEVLQEICTIEYSEVHCNDHYFHVEMFGVVPTSDLLNVENVINYLVQVAPIPYSPEDFPWGKEIIGHLATKGYNLPQYKISIKTGHKNIQLLKPYRSKFVIDKSKGTTDTIKNISFHRLLSKDGTTMALVWMAETGFCGTVVDKQIRGLRVRKGNILLGDAQTLNTIYKDARFNGWSIGEVFVMDLHLLPNARRDNFEKNPTYFLFVEQMTTIANDITKAIRAASSKRNSNMAIALRQIKKASAAVDKAVDNGVINSVSKENATIKINEAQRSLSNVTTSIEVDNVVREIAFDELDLITGRIQGVTAYKVLNATKSLTNTEKKIVEKILNAIKLTSATSKEEIVDEILELFCGQ